MTPIPFSRLFGTNGRRAFESIAPRRTFEFLEWLTRPEARPSQRRIEGVITPKECLLWIRLDSLFPQNHSTIVLEAVDKMYILVQHSYRFENRVEWL